MIRMANCCKRVGILLLTVTVVGGSSAAWGGDWWGTVGSAGTVDDADTSIAVFSGSTVTVSSSVATATLDMRYNVVPPNTPSEYGFNRLYWAVTLRDNGASAQVILKLYRCNLRLGTTTLLGSFNSNSYPPSNSFQLRELVSCCEESHYITPGDGTIYVYYIEAALKKYDGTGNPGLSAIGLMLDRHIGCIIP